LPQAEAAVAEAMANLHNLLGATGDVALPKIPADLPSIAAATSLAASERLAHLPELRVATSQLAAAKSRRQSATASFLPSVQVTGQAGQQATYINELEDDFVWTVGVGLSIPLFQGGANLANYRLTSAHEQEARHTLRKAELAARSRIDLAVVQEERYRRQLSAFRRQLEAADVAFQQSEKRYMAGLADYQSVLTALTARQQAELSVIQSHLALVLSRVELHQALGGQWPTAMASPAEETPQ